MPYMVLIVKYTILLQAVRKIKMHYFYILQHFQLVCCHEMNIAIYQFLNSWCYLNKYQVFGFFFFKCAVQILIIMQQSLSKLPEVTAFVRTQESRKHS